MVIHEAHLKEHRSCLFLFINGYSCLVIEIVQLEFVGETETHQGSFLFLILRSVIISYIFIMLVFVKTLNSANPIEKIEILPK